MGMITYAHFMFGGNVANTFGLCIVMLGHFAIAMVCTQGFGGVKSVIDLFVGITGVKYYRLISINGNARVFKHLTYGLKFIHRYVGTPVGHDFVIVGGRLSCFF